MASGVLGIGITALNAAQAGIRTTEHNISNVNTAGYRRQETVFATQTPSYTGAGWFGNGVAIESVRGLYSQFLDNEVLRDQTQLSRHEIYATQASQVDKLLGDDNSSLNTPLNAFFDSVNEVANDPTSTAARHVMLASGRNLAGRVNTLYNALQQRVDDSNKAVASLSTQINTYAKQIATLNVSINNLEAQNGQPANDLRDQRDQAIADLNKLADVTTLQQGSGELSVFIGNGQILVSGSQANQLGTPKADANDVYNIYPAPLLPQLNISATTSVALDSSQITGGELGGWLAERNAVLKPALASLNRVAVAIGAEVNKVHNGGVQLDGVTNGSDFFSSVAQQTAGASSRIEIQVTSSTQSGLPAASLPNYNYQVVYNLAGNDFSVTRIPAGGVAIPNVAASATGNEVVDTNGAKLGFKLALGTPAPTAGGETWTLNFQDYAHNMSVKLGTTDQIAAASSSAPTGPGDNRNALALAAIQTTGILDNGNTTLSGAYTQLVSNGAALASEADLNSKAFSALTKQATEAQQSVSGVNLDEEAVNLIRFQQAYQAAAKAISVANSLFDSILAIGA